MYKCIALDTRNLENAKAFLSNNITMGIEVTIPELAKMCSQGNIDPQHGCHLGTYDNGSGWMELSTDHPGQLMTSIPGMAAIEFAVKHCKPLTKGGGWHETMLPPDDMILVTIRPDLDSVGAMAVMALQLLETNLESFDGCIKRIEAIAEMDNFSMSGWSGPKNLPTTENPWSNEPWFTRPLAAVAMMVADYKVSLDERVQMMMNWLMIGVEYGYYREYTEKERLDMVAALESGKIKHETRADGKIAVVESTHRAAVNIGYSLAPVVVACNPALRLGGGDPHLKYTVCAFEAGKFVDIKSALAELNQLEAGWGGSLTIGGSPQGVNSQLTIDEVVSVVEKHLINN